jgi:hypothetical protein
MFQHHVSRRGPLLTLGLGIIVSITVGVLHAPTTSATASTGAGPAPSGDSYAHEWRSSDLGSAGEKKTPSPVPAEGALAAPAAEAVDGTPPPVPDDGALAAPAAEVVDGTPPPVPDDGALAAPTPGAGDGIQAPDPGDGAVTAPHPDAGRAEPDTPEHVDPAAPEGATGTGGDDAVVPEPSDHGPVTEGPVVPEAPASPPVVHAGPGPVEPTEGAITLIDPLVIERTDP